MLQKAGEYLCEGNDFGPGLDDLVKARKLDPALENIEMDLGMAYKLFKQEEAHNQFSKPSFEKIPNNLVSAVNNWGKLGKWDLHVCRNPQVLERELQYFLNLAVR